MCMYSHHQQLEAAQGCIDEEARQGLELLRAKTKELEDAQVWSYTNVNNMCNAWRNHRHDAQTLVQRHWHLHQILFITKLTSTANECSWMITSHTSSTTNTG